MRRRSFTWAGAVMLLITAALFTQVGCGDRGSSDLPPGVSPAARGEVLLLAAASTNDAVAELAEAYEAKTGVKVRITTGGSNALANQIMAGVPGEVFLAASADWADAVVTQGLAVENVPLLTNRLALVVPQGNPAGITSPADLTGDRVRRVALAGERVPAGMYAEQALQHAMVYDELLAGGRIARGQDVRLTLGYVETAEAEAGVVYLTDARASSRVEVVYTFPLASHDRIIYPLVLLKSSMNQEAGRRFFEYLSTDEAMRVFEKHGFSPAVVRADLRP